LIRSAIEFVEVLVLFLEKGPERTEWEIYFQALCFLDAGAAIKFPLMVGVFHRPSGYVYKP
jgi:hypothetical protein